MEWKFADPRNVAVIVTKDVMREGAWIAHVNHDEDDGSWSFLSRDADTSTTESMMLVGLSEVVEIDGSVAELADLPLGWRAWRASAGSPWIRVKQEERDE